MKINILYSPENIKQKVDLAVVIDVFRAFSTECYIFANNAEKILPVESVDNALELKKEHHDYLLMGEDQGEIPESFDYGNSPFEIKDKDFSGKNIIHSTSNGTKGIYKSINAEEIITGSFVNIGAIVRYIKQKAPNTVNLICTGTTSKSVLDEDHLCARYIEAALLDKETWSVKKIVDTLKKEGYADHYFDETVTSHPKEDFDYCLDIDRFDFVLKVVKSDRVYIERVN